jgi:hypothetical protein
MQKNHHHIKLSTMKTYISRVSLFFFISFFMGLFSNAQDCYWVSHAGGTSWDGADRMTIDKYGKK